MHGCNSMSVDRFDCTEAGERRREKDEDGEARRERRAKEKRKAVYKGRDAAVCLIFPCGRSSSHSPDHR